jgi:hypothetical protein
MGQQSNKVIKRKRRQDYLKRKKDQTKLGGIAKKKSSPKKSADEQAPAAKKPAAKKAAAKKAPAKKVAKKAPEAVEGAPEAAAEGEA